ncbi:MAG: hypothetical protein K2X47_15880, partial [Bdellovibrionales bacterium]|nr:hypothetical protein [Bdellovibrionales bacterium]
GFESLRRSLRGRPWLLRSTHSVRGVGFYGMVGLNNYFAGGWGEFKVLYKVHPGARLGIDFDIFGNEILVNNPSMLEVVPTLEVDRQLPNLSWANAFDLPRRINRDVRKSLQEKYGVSEHTLHVLADRMIYRWKFSENAFREIHDFLVKEFTEADLTQEVLSGSYIRNDPRITFQAGHLPWLLFRMRGIGFPLTPELKGILSPKIRGLLQASLRPENQFVDRYQHFSMNQRRRVSEFEEGWFSFHENADDKYWFEQTRRNQGAEHSCAAFASGA